MSYLADVLISLETFYQIEGLVAPFTSGRGWRQRGGMCQDLREDATRQEVRIEEWSHLLLRDLTYTIRLVRKTLLCSIALGILLSSGS